MRISPPTHIQLDTNAQDRCWIGITAIVRVTLRDGCFHEDLGYGHAENVKGRASALEKVASKAFCIS